MHHDLRPFSCDICNAAFRRKTHLNSHKETHAKQKKCKQWVPTTLKPQICSILHPRKAQRSSTLSTTRSLLKPEKPQILEVITLPALPGVVSTQSQSADRLAAYKHRCENCHKLFQQKSALNKHRRTHTGEKPYRCPFCPKSFADATNFKRHKLLHKRAAKELESLQAPSSAKLMVTTRSPCHSSYSDPDPDGLELMPPQHVYTSSDDSDMSNDLLWLSSTPSRSILNLRDSPLLSAIGSIELTDTLD